MKKNLKLSLAALLICSSTSVFADDSFQWHGYMRASMGMDQNFSNIDKSDYEVHSLGRYGLEYDDFVASTLSKRWTNDKGQWAQYNLGFNIFDYANKYTNATNSNTGDSSVNTLVSNDNYVEMGGLTFLPKDASLWVGKRRIAAGVDLLDLDYKKFNGHGFGYSSKAFDINLFKELNSGDMGEFADIVSIDATYKLKNLNIEGTFTKASEDSSNIYVDNTIKGDVSASVLAEYKNNKFLGLIPGNTTYRVQLGKGITADKLNMAVITGEKDLGTRATIDGITMTKDWVVNTVVNYESSKDDSANLTYTTLSVVGRGTNKITDNLSMIYEAGITSKTNNDLSGNISQDADGMTYKITAGPAIQIDSVPFVRPIIRFTGAVIGGEKKVTGFDKADELRLGAQFETWF